MERVQVKWINKILFIRSYAYIGLNIYKFINYNHLRVVSLTSSSAMFGFPLFLRPAYLSTETRARNPKS